MNKITSRENIVDFNLLLRDIFMEGKKVNRRVLIDASNIISELYRELCTIYKPNGERVMFDDANDAIEKRKQLAHEIEKCRNGNLDTDRIVSTLHGFNRSLERIATALELQ